MEHAPYTVCKTCTIRTKSFCGALPVRSLDSLANTRRLVRFERRQTIVCEGATAVSLFNIVSGVVKLYRSLPDGRTQIVGIRLPGEFFAIADGEKYTATAEALTSVVVCRFSRSRLKQLMQQFPQIQAKLLEMSYRHLAAAQDQIFLLGRKTAREKVASFLMRYSGKFDPERMDKYRRVPMTRTEIADFLGLTTETVSRVLTSFAREKLVAIDLSHSVRLLNIDLLRKIAGN